MNNRNRKIWMGLAGAVLATLSMSCGASAAQTQDSRDLARLLEQQRQQRVLQLKTDRARLLAQAQAAKEAAVTRAWQNPVAFAALVVGGYGVATRLSSDLTQSQRDVVDGMVILAAGYFLFNFEECSTLLRDLTAIESRRKRAQTEADAISAELR